METSFNDGVDKGEAIRRYTISIIAATCNYLNGEITALEYNRLRKVLENDLNKKVVENG